MPAIFHQLPFFDKFTTVEVQGHAYRILPLQIIVWVSLSPKGQPHFEPRTPRFPAVLDSGFTDGFLIHQQHLRQFAGFQPEFFRRLNQPMRTHERVISLYAANPWLHGNQAGQRDQWTSASPFLLELNRGIGISNDEEIYPRLPLLGARALRSAKLQVFLDYQQCRLSVRTPRRFWIFG